MTEAELAGRELDAAKILRARISVSLTFLAFGVTVGLWFVHIAVVNERLQLEPAILGLALLNVGLGSVIAPPIAGVIVSRIGSRRAGAIFAIAMAIVILGPILAPNYAFFYVSTFVAGMVGGCVNVAINTQASEVEKAHGRPLMSFFHGFFSLGGFIVAGLGGILFSLGLADGRGALIIVVVQVAVLAWAVRGYLPDGPKPDKPVGEKGPGFVLPNRAVLGFAVLAFLAATVEGSVGDWSALFLSTVKLTTLAEATLGYAMFSAAMTLCRFGGGPVVERLGDRRVVLYGGLFIAAGMATVLVAPWPLASAFGFLVIGIGAANISPVMVSVASRTPGVTPAIGVASVSTALAAGLLLGPPVIGFLAQAFGLAMALTAVGGLGLVIFAVVAGSWRAGPGTRPTPAAA